MNKSKINEGLSLLLSELPYLGEIRDESDYQNSIAALTELSSDDTVPSVLLKILANSIAEYETSRFPDLLKETDGTMSHGSDALITLMRHRKIKGKEMAEILELSPALLSSILNGKRALTIAHICKLADFFGVSRSVFI